MSNLFSKLFGGDKEAEETAKSLLKSIFGSQNETKPENKPEDKPEDAGEPEAQPANTSSGWDDEPSGFSWGYNMPAEENQYNFKGTYQEYFESIFNTEFAAYRFEKAIDRKRVIYTFYGPAKVLVVECV